MTQNIDLDDEITRLGCPMRGLAEDPEIRYTFYAPGTVCHKSDPPVSIPLEYQSEFCLCSNFTNCSVYQGHKAALSTAKRKRRVIAAAPPIRLAVPLLLVGVAIIAFSWLNFRRSRVDFPIESQQTTITDQGRDADLVSEGIASDLEASGDSAIPLETPTLNVTASDVQAASIVEEPTASPTIEPTEAATSLPTASPTVEPSPTHTVQPTERATVAPSQTPSLTPTPVPTETPIPLPTNTAVQSVIVRQPTATPNLAATQAYIDRLRREAAATATRQAVTAKQTVDAWQTQATATAQAGQAAANSAATRAAANANAEATRSAEATRDFWNDALTQTAQAVPPSDQDGDGIADSADACPNMPGTPELNGCAPTPTATATPTATPVPSNNGGGGGGGGSDDGREDGGDGRG